MRPRDIYKFIEGQGGEVIEIGGGKHWKVVARFGARLVVLVLPRSVSDHRALLNKTSWIKRQLK